jgi:hypothetical protein
MSKRPSLAETMRQVATAPESLPVQQATAVTVQGRPSEPQGRDGSFYAATRVGKKKVTAALAPADHKRLRQLALERDITTEALLIEAINDLFAKYGKGATGEGTVAL